MAVDPFVEGVKVLDDLGYGFIVHILACEGNLQFVGLSYVAHLHGLGRNYRASGDCVPVHLGAAGGFQSVESHLQLGGDGVYGPNTESAGPFVLQVGNEEPEC